MAEHKTSDAAMRAAQKIEEFTGDALDDYETSDIASLIDAEFAPLADAERVQIAMECARPIRGCATDEQYSDVVDRIMAALSRPGPNPEEVAHLKRIKDRIDTRLNNCLCEMKEGYDDSIVGFNEAWDIVRAIFKEELASPSPQPAPAADTLDAASRILCEWLGYSWDGIGEGRLSSEYKPWHVPTIGGRSFQGRKEDVRDIVRAIVAAVAQPAPAAPDVAGVLADLDHLAQGGAGNVNEISQTAAALIRTLAAETAGAVAANKACALLAERLHASLSAKEAEIERWKEAHAAARKGISTATGAMVLLDDEHKASLSAKEAECERLREALLELVPPELKWKEQGDGSLMITIQRSSLRRARSALSGKEAER